MCRLLLPYHKNSRVAAEHDPTVKTLRGRFRPTKCALVPHARAADYVYGTRHPLEKMAFEASLGPAQLGRSTGHRSTPSKTFLAAVVVSVSMKDRKSVV